MDETDDWDDDKCASCGEGDRDYDDPREVSISGDDPSLCRDCYEGALEEKIGELEEELIGLQGELSQLRRGKKKEARKAAKAAQAASKPKRPEATKSKRPYGTRGRGRR